MDDKENTLEDKPRPGVAIEPIYLVNALIDLQLAIRKTLLYSISHAAIKDAARHLDQKFKIIFQFVDSVSFGIAKDEILYQGNTLAKKNAIVRELARMLNKLNLAKVTFNNDLACDGILAFLQVISEARSLSTREREPQFDRFRQDCKSITFQFINLTDAVRVRTEENKNPDEQDRESGLSGTAFWHGLVNRLMSEQSSDQLHEFIIPDPDQMADPQLMAQLINEQVQNQDEDTKERSYDREIVQYLRDETNREALTSERRVHITKQLGMFISNLRPDIREQIFRVSMEPTQEGKAPLEDLAEVLPTSVLLEVINQIQLTDQNISSPMFSLLKKFVTLSISDEKLRSSLESKLTDRKDLFENLFVQREDRDYYPSSYRSLLDNQLAGNPLEPSAETESSSRTVEDPETNHHLALIMLELLDEPSCSKQQCETFINNLHLMLSDCFGGNHQSIMIEVAWVLMQQHQHSGENLDNLLGEQLKKFFTPEMLIHLFVPCAPEQEARRAQVLAKIKTFSGPELINNLLCLLETDERLSVRKRIMEIAPQCGPAVIPLAVGRLKSDKWYVVRNMVLLLRELQAREELSNISDCMKHSSSKVRMASLQALIALGADSDDLYEALARSMTDHDPSVFRAAASYLVSTHDARAIDLIRAQFQDLHQGKEQSERLFVIIKQIEALRARHLISLLSDISGQLESHLEKERMKSGLKGKWRFWQKHQQQPLHDAVKKAVQTLSAKKGANHG